MKGQKFNPDWPSAQADTPEARQQRRQAYNARRREIWALCKRVESVVGAPIKTILEEIVNRSQIKGDAMEVTPRFSAVSVAKQSLTEKDIEYAKQAIKMLLDYDGSPNQGFLLREDTIPVLNELIKIRLAQFIRSSSGVTVNVDAFSIEDIQRRGFTLRLGLYGVQASTIISLLQTEGIFLDDSLARSVAHHLIATAAVGRWGL